MPQQAPLFAGSDRAFPSHARLDRYFPSASAEEARTRLTGCIERGEGPAVLIGASGSGKSMLLEVLADAFADRFAVAHLANTQICTRRALLQAILHALGLGHRDHEEGDLRLKLVDHLQSVADCPAGALLLIDEAQSLAPRLLEELRVIGNLARRGVPLVRLVLAGSTQLEECLAAPELETLNQRIAARCYLSPLAYDELSQYVRAHIAATGANPDELLGDDAAAAVFEATDGIPRLVNQLCDRAIVLAVAAGATRIDRVAIQNAWSDLHQLPAPWHSPEPALPEEALSEEHDAAVVDSASTPEPLWNADAALDQVANEVSVEVADEIVAEVGELNGANTSGTPSTVVEPAPVDAKIDTDGEPLPSPRAKASAADPFGEDFEEEEMLLDRYAASEKPFPSGAPVVVNQQDDEISGMVATLTPVAEEPNSATEGAADASGDPVSEQACELVAEQAPESVIGDRETVEQKAIGLVFPVGADEPIDDLQEAAEREAIETSCSSDAEFDAAEFGAADFDAESEPAVLLIEDDNEPAAISMVRRKEYRQLFASLRGG